MRDLVERLRVKPSVIELQHDNECRVNDAMIPNALDCSCGTVITHLVRLNDEAADALEAKERELSTLRSNYETAQANWNLTLARAEAAERQLATARQEALEEAAKVAENAYGGRAHTYASENAELYRAQDEACARIAKRIRSLSPQPPVKSVGEEEQRQQSRPKFLP